MTARTWELNLRSQSWLLREALVASSLRAWHTCVNSLFARAPAKRGAAAPARDRPLTASDAVKRLLPRRYRRRRRRWRRRRKTRRHRRCVINRDEIHAQILERFSRPAVVKRNIEALLKAPRCYRGGRSAGELVATVAWRAMTPRQRAALTCVVTSFVQKSLRTSLLSLADTRCIRERDWGRLREEERKRVLDEYLTMQWVSRKGEVTGHQVAAGVERMMRERITRIVVVLE